MTVVVDSSVVVAALLDQGPVGSWAEALLLSGPLAGPHLLPAEVANILRRAVAAGNTSARRRRTGARRPAVPADRAVSLSPVRRAHLGIAVQHHAL